MCDLLIIRYTLITLFPSAHMITGLRQRSSTCRSPFGWARNNDSPKLTCNNHDLHLNGTRHVYYREGLIQIVDVYVKGASDTTNR